MIDIITDIVTGTTIDTKMVVIIDIAVIGKDIVRHSLKNRFSKHGKHHRILLYESMILMYIVLIFDRRP